MSVEKVEIGDATLYLGDAREILPSLGGVDITITDPPYAERTHSGARTSHGEKALIDFAAISLDSFIEYSRLLLAVTKRWVVMTCDWKHAARLEDCELPLVRLGVWVKPNAAPQFTGDRPGTGWEAVAILHRQGRKKWNGGGHAAIWNVPKVCGEHPTQKPLKLIEQWILLFSDPEETVLDPFMGSGTTGVASLKHGRKFTGIEIERRYFDVACKRIEEFYSQPTMFPPARTPQTQEVLTL